MNNIDEKPSLAELYHHGVLGMKWGVVKDRFKGAVGKAGAAARSAGAAAGKVGVAAAKIGMSASVKAGKAFIAKSTPLMKQAVSKVSQMSLTTGKAAAKKIISGIGQATIKGAEIYYDRKVKKEKANVRKAQQDIESANRRGDTIGQFTAARRRDAALRRSKEAREKRDRLKR